LIDKLTRAPPAEANRGQDDARSTALAGPGPVGVGQRLGVVLGLQRLGLSALWALAVASAFGVVFSVLARTWWRRAIIGLGFPCRWRSRCGHFTCLGLAVAAGAAPADLPLNAWRDAPLFPTPAHALHDLATFAPLPAGALLLDAGSGLGDGLKALREAYPQPSCMGWNGVGRCGLKRLRCHGLVSAGRYLRADWRPTLWCICFSGPRAWRGRGESAAQLMPGAWLVSLEFEAPSLKPQAVLRCRTAAGVAVPRTVSDGNA